MRAKHIIEEEHRSLAAVLHGMLYTVREIRYMGIKPDFVLLEAMVHYIDAFQERFHHPKEDAYLFKLLRSRYPGAAPLLDRLKQDHESGAVKLRELRQALTRCQQGGSSEFSDFVALVAGYAAFHWGHMRLEENDLLPLAQRHLIDADWDEIDAAFLGHTDPLFGVGQGNEFQELFHRIVNLAPPPIGLGLERRRT